MDLASQAVARFLRKLEVNSNSPDAAEGVTQFAEVFLAAGPDGAIPVRASEFSFALRKRKELFNRAGCRNSTLTSSQATPLDSRYVLVHTTWQMSFAPSGREATGINVSSTLIIDIASEEPKAVFYLAHQDILKVLEERQLLTT